MNAKLDLLLVSGLMTAPTLAQVAGGGSPDMGFLSPLADLGSVAAIIYLFFYTQTKAIPAIQTRCDEINAKTLEHCAKINDATQATLAILSQNMVEQNQKLVDRMSRSTRNLEDGDE